MNIGIGHNQPPAFDFFAFFDCVVDNLDMSSAEKLLQIILARRSHAVGGKAVDPSRAELARQASCSEATVKRSFRILEAFFEVNPRAGKRTEYTPRASVTQDQVELAILGMRPAKGVHREPPTPTLGEPPAHGEPGSHSAPAHGVRVMVSPHAESEAHGEPPLKERFPHTPLKENTTLHWRERANLDKLETALLTACNGAASAAASPGLLSMAEPIKWLENGCDLELDILPTVKARAHKLRPGSLKAWSYFTDAIADAKATRLKPMPNGGARANYEPKPRRKTTDEMTLEEYRAHLERGGV